MYIVFKSFHFKIPHSFRKSTGSTNPGMLPCGSTPGLFDFIYACAAGRTSFCIISLIILFRQECFCACGCRLKIHNGLSNNIV